MYTSKAGSRADSKLSRKDEGSCALTASRTVSFTLSLIFAEMLGTRSRRICSDSCSGAHHGIMLVTVNEDAYAVDQTT